MVGVFDIEYNSFDYLLFGEKIAEIRDGLGLDDRPLLMRNTGLGYYAREDSLGRHLRELLRYGTDTRDRNFICAASTERTDEFEDHGVQVLNIDAGVVVAVYDQSHFTPLNPGVVPAVLCAYEFLHPECKQDALLGVVRFRVGR